MGRPDKKSPLPVKRLGANGRNSRGARSAKDGSSDFTIGLANFEKISAVEGLNLSAAMKRRFREFEREGLSAAARRQRIIAKYGK